MLPFYLAPVLTYNFNVNPVVSYYMMMKDKPDAWEDTYGKGANLNIHSLDENLPFMKDLYSKLKHPEWIKHSELFRVPPHSVLPAHIDKGRHVGLNIPVYGDFESTSVDNYDISQIPNRLEVNGATGFGGVAKLVTRTYYACPMFLHTSVPHGVTNNTDKQRVILSVSFHEKVTMRTIVQSEIMGDLWSWQEPKEII